MPVLGWIVLVTVSGGVLSILAAGAFALTAGARMVNLLVSYAIGALLGAAFIEVLPHAIIASGDATSSAMTVLFGILGFFLLEKLVLWRHCHVEACEGHGTRGAGNEGHDHGRSGTLVLVGDTFHNFVDGVLIAAAFMESVQLGIVTSLAIVAHEIPQEVGDFVILLHSGFRRGRALAYNLLSSLAMVVGGLLAYLALTPVQGAVPTFLALAAASMIYVAVADLIPGLHKRPELAATVQQALLIGAGVATIWLAHHFIGHLGE